MNMSYIYLAWADKTGATGRHIKVGRTTRWPSERYSRADRTTVVTAARVNDKYLNEAEMALKNYFATHLSNMKISPERWVAKTNTDWSESVRLFRSFCSKHRLKCERVPQKPYLEIQKYQDKTVVSARVPYVLAEDVKRICHGRSYDGHKESLSSIITDALMAYRKKHREEYPRSF